MSYPNPNSILGHNFIAPDTISYRNLYKILSGGGHFDIGHYYVLHLHPKTANDKLSQITFQSKRQHMYTITIMNDSIIMESTIAESVLGGSLFVLLFYW
jgi:hypothetical protein